MSDDQDGCEWVNVSSGTGLTGSPGQKAVKQLCVCVCVHRGKFEVVQAHSVHHNVALSQDDNVKNAVKF